MDRALSLLPDANDDGKVDLENEGAKNNVDPPPAALPADDDNCRLEDLSRADQELLVEIEDDEDEEELSRVWMQDRMMSGRGDEQVGKDLNDFKPLMSGSVVVLRDILG